MIHHILSFSGGKDSTAMYLHAMESGRDFLPVFADTGNEHEATLDYVRDLPRLTGGPAIRWVKADFSGDFERKRRFVEEQWPKDGVPDDRVRAALEALHPTRVPFLDLCMMKGRFPSTRARFCSEELKYHPIFYQVQEPLLEDGQIVCSWQGVRADESASRAKMRRWEHVGGGLWNWRPIFRWTVEDVFAIHRRHGIEPNPLYKQGMGRVGCMPCIHARKSEIKEIAHRFSDHIARIELWEALVGDCSKRFGIGSFFAVGKTPGHDKSKPSPGIWDVVEWANTDRGGRQFRLFDDINTDPGCLSIYGLCE